MRFPAEQLLLSLCTCIVSLAALPGEGEAKWVWTSETGLVDTDTYAVGDPQELYTEATELFNAGKYSDAATEFIRIAEFTPDPDYREKSLFMAGEAFFKDERFHRSYLCFEEYLYNYPKTDKLRIVLRREAECGFKMMDGAAKELMGLPILPGGSTGKEIVKSVLRKYPYEEFSEEFAFRLASYYFTQGDYEEAEMEYDLFLKTYPESAWSPTAAFRKGMANIGKHSGVEYDSAPLQTAKADFEKYIENNPHSDKVSDAQEQLQVIAERMAEKEYNIGLFYFKRGKSNAAVYYMESVIGEFPTTSWAGKARRFIEELKNRPTEEKK
jgi:outer membrane assembly lipoprotein YfiO